MYLIAFEASRGRDVRNRPPCCFRFEDQLITLHEALLSASGVALEALENVIHAATVPR